MVKKCLRNTSAGPGVVNDEAPDMTVEIRVNPAAMHSISTGFLTHGTSMDIEITPKI